MRFVTLSLLCFVFSSFQNPTGISVDFVASVNADFSFAQKWDYPEGVYKNSIGQLVCDAYCTPAQDSMKENGRIRPGMESSFYATLDTSHLHYTLKSEARTYEWIPSNYAKCYRIPDGYRIATATNAGCHSSLELLVYKNKAEARIICNSVTRSGQKVYEAEPTGYVKLDQNALANDTLKGSFEIYFNDTMPDGQKMYFKGTVLTGVQ